MRAILRTPVPARACGDLQYRLALFEAAQQEEDGRAGFA
jgi:hypothetical protein